MEVVKKIQGKEIIYDVEKDINIFCPNCGKKEVFIEVGEGDFYEGPTNYCKNCNYSFTMPSLYFNDNIIFKE